MGIVIGYLVIGLIVALNTNAGKRYGDSVERRLKLKVFHTLFWLPLFILKLVIQRD